MDPLPDGAHAVGASLRPPSGRPPLRANRVARASRYPDAKPVHNGISGGAAISPAYPTHGPRNDVDLPTRDRPERDRQRRPLTPAADDPSQRSTRPMSTRAPRRPPQVGASPDPLIAASPGRPHKADTSADDSSSGKAAVSATERRRPLSASCSQPNGLAASDLARVQAARVQNGAARSQAAQPSSSPIAGPGQSSTESSIYIGKLLPARAGRRRHKRVVRVVAVPRPTASLVALEAGGVGLASGTPSGSGALLPVSDTAALGVTVGRVGRCSVVGGTRRLLGRRSGALRPPVADSRFGALGVSHEAGAGIASRLSRPPWQFTAARSQCEWLHGDGAVSSLADV